MNPRRGDGDGPGLSETVKLRIVEEMEKRPTIHVVLAFSGEEPAGSDAVSSLSKFRQIIREHAAFTRRTDSNRMYWTPLWEKYFFCRKKYCKEESG